MTNQEFGKIARQIPPSHPDTEESFRAECIRGKYLIYDGKKNRAVCTNCGHEFEIAPGEYSHMHGHRDTCPVCGEVVICRSAGLGRAGLKELHRLMTFASDGKNLWIVQNDVVVRFEEFERAQLYRKMVEVFQINAEEQKHWRYRDGYWSASSYWDEIKSFNPAPLPAAPYFPTKWQQHIFREGIEDIVANSDCKYLMGDEFTRALQWASITSWISLQMKYPALELLRKGGFETLARHRITGSGYGNYLNAINIRANTIEGALRLSKKWVRLLRTKGIGTEMTSKELKAFQRLDDKNKQMAIDNWAAWTEIVTGYRGDVKMNEITKYTTFERYLTYMTSQGAASPQLFTDYLMNAAALGWDLRRKRILFPKDLKEAHDRAAEQREMEKNAINDALMRSHAVDVDYTINNLVALCAKSQWDLNNESSTLHHCVKTYGDKVADGSTLIYFVRMADQVDIPYYTLEINPEDGHVIQCRGSRNCSMTPEVKEFKDGFEKAFKKMLKEGDTRCRTTA